MPTPPRPEDEEVERQETDETNRDSGSSSGASSGLKKRRGVDKARPLAGWPRPFGKSDGRESIVALQRRVAIFIREETDDLQVLVRTLVGIATGQPTPTGQVPSVIQMRAASEYLIDRVLGRPSTPIEYSTEPRERPQLAALDPATIDQLAALLDGALAPASDEVLAAAREEERIEQLEEQETTQDVQRILDVEATEVKPLDVKQSDVRKSDVKPLRSNNRTSESRTSKDWTSNYYQLRLAPSTALSRVYWHPDTKVCVVRFPDGAQWRYENITADMVAQWEHAPSAGAFFHRQIRAQAAAIPRRPLAHGEVP